MLALILLGASLLTVSAHETPTQNDDYGISFTIDRNDDKTSVVPGTVLTFYVVVQRTGVHNVPSTAQLASVTPGGYPGQNLGTALTQESQIVAKTVKYTVQPTDLAGASRRTALIQFSLTFAPGHTGGSDHEEIVFKSNKVPVVVTQKRQTASDETSEVNLIMEMASPSRFAKDQKVTFTLTVTTGKYWLFRSKPVRIRKQLYAADGGKVGGATTAKSIIIRPLKTEAQVSLSPVTYKLTEKDVAAARVEFSYEISITEDDLRDDDGNATDHESDFQETFTWSRSIGPAVTPTPVVTPTPAVTVITTSRYATITETSRNVIHIDRHDGGQDFSLTLGSLSINGAHVFHLRGYIRDDSLTRGGQTYAVVRREADNEIVRMWISPESPDRLRVPWAVVNRAPYTVPTHVLSAIKLDETRPVENQLARRFDVLSDGRIFVYRNNAWHWIPDIPTFQANGFYWCDVMAADAAFFSRALIGEPLEPSGGASNPNYPNCHSK